MLPVAGYECPFQCCGVEFSPFEEQRLAIATAQYFGVVGNGRLHIVDLASPKAPLLQPGASHPPPSTFVEVSAFDSPQGLYDCTWNEANQFQIATASADGSVALWDLGVGDGYPVVRWHEHTQEAASVDWNLVDKSTLVSSSWDGTVKLWAPEHSQALTTFQAHSGPVYNAIWSPHSPAVLTSCSADQTARVWDVSGPAPVLNIKAHDDEVLAVDWDKYNEWSLVTGSVDRTIRTWDTRFPAAPVHILVGHGYSIKRLKCHPHVPSCVGSVSYDMSACLWDARPQGAGLIGRSSHTEFVVGLDFNLFAPERMVTCSWDRKVTVWDAPINVALLPASE